MEFNKNTNKIGMLNESSLHAALKAHYARPEDTLEVEVDGYVIDIIQDGCLVEIQTGNFASIKHKVIDLTDRHPLRVVYPITQEKWIVKLPEDGIGTPERRKSPKRGRIVEIFNELVSFPEILHNANFSLEVLMIQEEEVRRFSGVRRFRNRGWVTEERRLLGIVDQYLFEGPESVCGLIPKSLPDEFTTLDFADALGEPRRFAQKAAYCLRKIGVIVQIGKRGKSKLYSLT
jgi:hypothetical protein